MSLNKTALIGFFTADILTNHHRKGTGGINNANDGSVPSSVPVNHDNKPACTTAGPPINNMQPSSLHVSPATLSSLSHSPKLMYLS